MRRPASHVSAYNWRCASVLHTARRWSAVGVDTIIGRRTAVAGIEGLVVIGTRLLFRIRGDMVEGGHRFG